MKVIHLYNERGRYVLNIGKKNSGFYNIGDRNSGGFNFGSMNVGDGNVGDYNLGNYNVGNKNLGNENSGDYNLGNYNAGDFNLCDNSSGVFCTKEKTIYFFDEPSDLTLEEWRSSLPYEILKRISTVKWIKTDNGEHLVKLNFQESCRELWSRLTHNEKNILLQMPNFNAQKFLLITGINIYI